MFDELRDEWELEKLSLQQSIKAEDQIPTRTVEEPTGAFWFVLFTLGPLIALVLLLNVWR